MNTTRLAHEHWACQVTHIVFAFDSFHVFTHTTGLFWHFFVHARGRGYAWTAFTQTWIEMPCTLGYYLLHNSFSSPQRSQPLLGAHFCSHYWYTKMACPWVWGDLPLSYDNWTITSPHNPLYVLHRWDWNASVTNLATSQYVPSELHMENFLHQEKTHAEWFLTVNAQSILPPA